jgi:hypothetical protein
MVLSPKQLFVVGVIIVLCTALEAARSMIPYLTCSLLNDEDVRHSGASHGEVYADGSTPFGLSKPVHRWKLALPHQCIYQQLHMQ